MACESANVVDKIANNLADDSLKDIFSHPLPTLLSFPLHSFSHLCFLTYELVLINVRARGRQSISDM